MQKRALDYIRKLNDEGWTINEQMADKFIIFAKAEVARELSNQRNKIIETIKNLS